ncbi:MAG: hypothetical protein GX181_10655 [Synergistaceae bacterium]|nr:hypothetical protein [Synergistaceae bacterium]
MVIVNVLGGIMLVICGIMFIYYASLLVLMCYDERKEELRRQKEDLEEREEFEGIRDDWTWSPEQWDRFLEIEEKFRKAVEESKGKNVPPGTHH